ncbi:cobyrinic acid a,c-diamide synthase [Frateuria sp. Soil773]|uniref:cobyrinate a,c-diamide synthase n=1 Tax=Frateuria sp. Soil773 TaxID=1736407 RepID=UPI0006F7D835|nr:cobyrinate a,c-diamide synthase [Frateuria sp. Soil773]KRE88714.1 cobyrinic acid a,c-diamide synthase [Frateuria sp. Soil773]
MNAPRRCPALLVSAPASGQGKTSVTAALARWHARQGRRVRVFKSGPDFLDPMVLERAAGAPAYQLDLWMCGEADVRARLYEAAGAAELILVEGVMGLFDGEPSSADLAQRFGLPVLAVIDGSAMAQTFGALACGLARYRDGLAVHGVAANRIGSAYHAQLLRGSLPPQLHWLGALPRDAALALPERHLGLVAADELDDIDARLDALADAWSLHADTALPPAATFAADRHPGESRGPAPSPAAAEGHPAQGSAGTVPRLLAGRRIAVARDAAFCFLYPANLDLLREAGAEIAFFSPLAGEPLPDCDAAWLPGGYPELHLAALSQRTDLHAALRAHRDAGKPLLAECGGLLFALDTLADRDGNRAAMAGLLPGSAALQPWLAALGLQGVELPEGALRGHTFHYAQARIDAAPLAQATNPNGGPSSEAVYRERRFTASFVHFYFPSNPAAALRLFLP